MASERQQAEEKDMDITIEIDNAALYGPEVNTALPASFGVSFHTNLNDAIRTGLLEKIKAKAIYNGLIKDKTWKMSGGVTDGLDEKKADKFVGNHKVKVKLNGVMLDKQVKLVIAGSKKPEKAEPVGKVNNAAVATALQQLDQISSRFGEPRVTVKAGDKKHPKARQYVLKAGDEEWSGSIPDPEDSHIKESSRNTAIKQWNKSLKEFLTEVKTAG
jgi:hypothetical protein